MRNGDGKHGAMVRERATGRHHGNGGRQEFGAAENCCGQGG
ncbi:hypothetical protein [Marvinbryantia formatexigens]|nr:hypothetical protein [Marvinbryantia formatexigens]UWO26596.1 hypothetical protein NQ534_09115 [Marvinbryantia formatexigens DSM 14469]